MATKVRVKLATAQELLELPGPGTAQVAAIVNFARNMVPSRMRTSLPRSSTRRSRSKSEPPWARLTTWWTSRRVRSLQAWQTHRARVSTWARVLLAGRRPTEGEEPRWSRCGGARHAPRGFGRGAGSSACRSG